MQTIKHLCRNNPLVRFIKHPVEESSISAEYIDISWALGPGKIGCLQGGPLVSSIVFCPSQTSPKVLCCLIRHKNKMFCQMQQRFVPYVSKAKAMRLSNQLALISIYPRENHDCEGEKEIGRAKKWEPHSDIYSMHSRLMWSADMPLVHPQSCSPLASQPTCE